jgi:hypothetical protein
MSDIEEGVPMLTVSLVNDEVSDSMVDIEWVDEFDLMPYDTQITFIEQLIELLENTLEWVVEASEDEIVDEEDVEDEDADA